MEERTDYSIGTTPTPASVVGGKKSADRVRYYFVADLHLGHRNVLKYHPERAEMMGISPDDPESMEKHDEWIIGKWNETVRKKDYVYILGDFSFHSSGDTEKILQRLHGKKFLIRGNHDASCRGLERYFETVSDIKEVIFKKKNPDMDFLEEDLRITMCHFPLITWNCKTRGAVHLHGHVHGGMDMMNREAPELRIDVGVDSDTMDGPLIEVEDVYRLFKDKAGGKYLETYARGYLIDRRYVR